MDNNSNNILLAFYGDDFTGSTDALEFLARAGAKTALFIEPPTPEQLKKYPGLNAFGVAGKTRAMAPSEMEQTLLPAFEQLKQIGARHVHYKVCSTFDSSPTIGSIGKAIDTGMAVFKNKCVPLLVAAPVLGRYCMFGNLFARMGIGSNGKIYRLDRHPSMSKHPATPADESDLRVHLEKQTKKKTGLIDILQLSNETIAAAWEQVVQQGFDIALFDALYQEQLKLIGELIDAQANTGTLFSVGSSGIEMALGQHWNSTNQLTSKPEWKHPGKAAPLLVIVGSCSPVTAGQISYVRSKGFEEILLDAPAICNNDHQSIHASISKATDLLNKGKHVIISTGGAGLQQTINLPAAQLGAALGTIARDAAAQSPIKRIVIAGGDTSSYTTRAMGIEAVEMIAALVPGAPLCKATAPGSPIDGLDVNFKGGQVGGDDYFEVLMQGHLN
ncbi:serine kinase [Niastella koreensis]|uniref:Type III effector Hrp-dependent outer n=2 Tax=Niastella koreensis TaxID=354356 RepID=G8TNH1_NIAKG|nr:four-carbon acid sugar kinase family protein [Niastella koreensis]AEV99888.1 type III effector Hrp-dependent outer [Niastella koreensis GR20-10]OQP51499.1 serine kinase [Niastella koreensis]